MSSGCSICDAALALTTSEDKTTVPEDHVLASGFALGVLVERISHQTQRPIATALCEPHHHLIKLFTAKTADRYPQLAPFLDFSKVT